MQVSQNSLTKYKNKETIEKTKKAADYSIIFTDYKNIFLLLTTEIFISLSLLSRLQILWHLTFFLFFNLLFRKQQPMLTQEPLFI